MALATKPLILALDLGRQCGFCVGLCGGGVPISGSWKLSSGGDSHGVAYDQLIRRLEEMHAEFRPTIIFKEDNRALRIAFNSKEQRRIASVKMTDGLHAMVEMMGVRLGVPVKEANMDTVRKHFIGIARLGDRDLLKRTVVDRAILLKYMTRGSTDDDQADACAVWDWAASTIGSPIGQLVLT